MSNYFFIWLEELMKNSSELQLSGDRDNCVKNFWYEFVKSFVIERGDKSLTSQIV